MATAPALVSLATRQQVMLERLKAGDVKKLEAFLKDAAKVIRERLSRDDLTALSRARAEAQLSAIVSDLRAIYGDASKQIQSDLVDLAEYTAGAEARALGAVLVEDAKLAVPSAAQVMAAASARPLGQGKTAAMLEPFVNAWASGSVDKVENAIRLGYFQGKTNKEIINEVVGTASNKYRDGLIDATYRNGEAVVRTAVQHVAQVARSEMWAQNADIIEAYEWVSVLDNRTTQQCQALSGQIFEMGKGPLPPIHINCLTGDTNVLSCSRISNVYKRTYEGVVIDVTTRSGRSITITPNHPVLTVSGWKIAGDLDLFDKVVCIPSPIHNNDEYKIEAKFSELFSAVNVSADPGSIGNRPATAKDFHGDAANGDIQIVNTDSLGWDSIRKLILNGRKDISLMKRSSARSALKSLCALLLFKGRGSSSSRGIMGSARKMCDLFGRGVSHSCVLLFRAVSLLMPNAFKYSFDDIGRSLEPFCYSGYSYPRNEQGFNFGFPSKEMFAGAFRLANDIDSCSRESPVDDALADARICADILSGHSGKIEIDDIIDVVRRSFSGHVYNLENAGNWYLSNGIVTHNCRSSTTPVIANKQLREALRKNATQASKGAEGGEQVAADLTYYEWLKTQPASFQDEAMGPVRAKLFRDGGISAERFAELSIGKNFEPLTLDEMRALEPVAFERAGL